MGMEFHFPAHPDYFKEQGFNQQQVQHIVAAAESLMREDGLRILGARVVFVREPGKFVGVKVVDPTPHPAAGPGVIKEDLDKMNATYLSGAEFQFTNLK